MQTVPPAFARSGAPANIINHITIVADESSSMTGLSATLVKVFDNTVAHLAAQSRANGQETRITAYFFNSKRTARCVIYDMDVLRTPSIAGLYQPRGMTALVDATLLSVEDMRMIPQKYGDHSFLTLVLTDGGENDSFASGHQLSQVILSAPENETYGCLVPNQMGVHEAKRHGFPAGNISVWDATSAAGLEEVGRVIQDLSDAYMDGRARGVRGYSARSAARSGGGLFQMRKFTAADVEASLIPVTPGSFYWLDVTEADKEPGRKGAQLDRFFERATGQPYQRSRCYYQLTDTVKVQNHKDIAYEVNGVLYSGTLAETRGFLGLPGDLEVKLRPDQKEGVTIFIQSTSNNRTLFPGTRLLVMR